MPCRCTAGTTGAAVRRSDTGHRDFCLPVSPSLPPRRAPPRRAGRQGRSVEGSGLPFEPQERDDVPARALRRRAAGRCVRSRLAAARGWPPPAGDAPAPAPAPEDPVTCGPASAALRAPPSAEDAPGRRAPASRPRRRPPLPPPESRAASVGGAAGLQAGLSARRAGRAAPRAPSGHRPAREAAAGPGARLARQLRPGRGRGGRGRARSGERGSGGGMWMLAVALLHSISHGERWGPRALRGKGSRSRGAGRGGVPFVLRASRRLRAAAGEKERKGHAARQPLRLAHLQRRDGPSPRHLTARLASSGTRRGSEGRAGGEVLFLPAAAGKVQNSGKCRANPSEDAGGI